MSQATHEAKCDRAFNEGRAAGERHHGLDDDGIRLCPYSPRFEPYVRNAWLSGWRDGREQRAYALSDGPSRPNNQHPVGGLW
jgi:ribosome modulation factor